MSLIQLSMHILTDQTMTEKRFPHEYDLMIVYTDQL